MRFSRAPIVLQLALVALPFGVARLFRRCRGQRPGADRRRTRWSGRPGPRDRRDGRAEIDADRDPGHRHGRSVFDRRRSRADHRPVDGRQVQGRRRRQEGPGAVRARSTAARNGAAAGAGEPRPRHRTGGERGVPGQALSGPRRARHCDPRTGRHVPDRRHRLERDGRGRPRGGRERQGPAAVRDDRRSAVRSHRRADGARREPGPGERHASRSSSSIRCRRSMSRSRFPSRSCRS